MIKRLIFDVDGTLVTNVKFKPFIEEALRKYEVVNYQEKALEYIKYIPEYEICHKGYDISSYLSFFTKKLGISFNIRFWDFLVEELKGCIASNGKEIAAMLQKLNNYELVILSNFFEVVQLNKLKGMGINDFFTEYYGEEIIKQNSDAYIMATGPHKPEECVMIGDNKELDIDAAAKLGLHTIWINSSGDVNSVEEITPELIRSLERKL